MPIRPPIFGKPNGVTKRKPWTSVLTKHARIRGRAGVELRKKVRREEPYCRLCLNAGRSVATDEVDHIKPLADGGTNHRANLQGLCKPCHEAKSATERGQTRRS